MSRKIEVTVDVIVHSTEDVSKILQAFEDVLGLEADDFAVSRTTGYFGNPITMLGCRLARGQATEFVRRMTGLLPDGQVDSLINQIPERTANSRFHMRLDKQDLVRGTASATDDGSIKIGIQTPIYCKDDTVGAFLEILRVGHAPEASKQVK